MTTSLNPTQTAERISTLDLLRGFAIFGILMVNMQLFYKPITSMLLGADLNQEPLHLAGDMLIKLLFEGKFYVLFSFLFGYGFWLFISRGNGASTAGLFARRLLYLLLFGALHIALLWAGDILFVYALLGFALLLLRKKSDRGLIKWALWLISIPIILSLFSWLMMLAASLSPQGLEAATASIEGSVFFINQLYKNAFETYSTGTFSDIVNIRLSEYTMLLPGFLFFYPTVLAMFLVGAWAARRNLLGNLENSKTLFKKMFWVGVCIGIPTTIIYTIGWTRTSPSVPGAWSFVSSSTSIISGITVSMLYVSSIVLLKIKGKTRTMEKWIAPVGRMALTNYLLHSIICTTLFLSYGFAQFGSINVWQGILLTLVIYGLQIPFSRWWLGRFQFGPFEWLWRSLTYWKWQPFIIRK